MRYIEYMIGEQVGIYLTLAELRSCIEFSSDLDYYNGLRIHRFVDYDYDNDFVRYIRVRNGRVIFSKK